MNQRDYKFVRVVESNVSGWARPLQCSAKYHRISPETLILAVVRAREYRCWGRNAQASWSGSGLCGCCNPRNICAQGVRCGMCRPFPVRRALARQFGAWLLAGIFQGICAPGVHMVRTRCRQAYRQVYPQARRVRDGMLAGRGARQIRAQAGVDGEGGKVIQVIPGLPTVCSTASPHTYTSLFTRLSTGLSTSA